MTILEIKNHLSNLVGHITFVFNGYSCGIDPLSLDSFDMWYGDDEITVDSIEKVLNVKFFSGNSLTEIWNDVTDVEY